MNLRRPVSVPGVDKRKKGEIFKLLLPPLSFDAPLFYYCAPIYIWIYILYTSRNSGEFEMVQQCMVGEECLLPMKLNRPSIDWYMAYKCRNNIRVSHHLKRGCHTTHTYTYEELLGNKITQKLLPGENNNRRDAGDCVPIPSREKREHYTTKSI